MKPIPARCLVLACGNTLREDDGVGPWLAAWVEERFAGNSCVRVESRQQWTPELAEELAVVQSAIFIDCAADTPPGSVQLVSVDARREMPGLATHHLDAVELLAMSVDLYGSAPRTSLLLKIGAGSLGLREGFSEPVQAALPEACKILEREVLGLLKPDESAPSVSARNPQA